MSSHRKISKCKIPAFIRSRKQASFRIDSNIITKTNLIKHRIKDKTTTTDTRAILSPCHLKNPLERDIRQSILNIKRFLWEDYHTTWRRTILSITSCGLDRWTIVWSCVISELKCKEALASLLTKILKVLFKLSRCTISITLTASGSTAKVPFPLKRSSNLKRKRKNRLRAQKQMATLFILRHRVLTRHSIHNHRFNRVE